MVSIFFYVTLVGFIVMCVFLMLLILIQKGRGGGLSSAFGGAGGHTAFGAKTGDVLTWATSIVFGLFLLMAVALNLLANRVSAGPGLGEPDAPAQQTPQPPPTSQP